MNSKNTFITHLTTNKQLLHHFMFLPPEIFSCVNFFTVILFFRKIGKKIVFCFFVFSCVKPREKNQNIFPHVSGWVEKICLVKLFCLKSFKKNFMDLFFCHVWNQRKQSLEKCLPTSDDKFSQMKTQKQLIRIILAELSSHRVMNTGERTVWIRLRKGII